jgi:hypothetical protein
MNDIDVIWNRLAELEAKTDHIVERLQIDGHPLDRIKIVDGKLQPDGTGRNCSLCGREMGSEMLCSCQMEDENGKCECDGTATKELKCPHCGKDEGTWFDRTLDENGDMCTRCNSCGGDVDKPVTSREKKWKPSDDESKMIQMMQNIHDEAESFLARIKKMREG